VGWVKADSKAIQAIHTHVITHNPRVFVSHSGHTEWHLHIKTVREEDRGSYMCQINTDPMISQVSFLEVVIPPDFIPEETSGDMMAPEGSTVKLNCNAKGHPTPTIQWRRENNQNITLKSSSGAKVQMATYEGNILRLLKVTRADMGAYLCIASNGVPPTISKRITVSVHFHPAIHVPNQLVGAPIGSPNVTLECNIEAYPRSIHFWTKDRGSSMIISTERYEVREILRSMFEVKMILIIHSFRRADAGSYECIAKNSLGDNQGVVKLHALNLNDDDDGGGEKSNKSPGNAFVYDNEESEYEEETVVVTRTPESNNPYYKNTKAGDRNRNKGREGTRDHETSHSGRGTSTTSTGRHKNTHHTYTSINTNNNNNNKNGGSNQFQTVIVPVNPSENSDSSSAHITPHSTFFLVPITSTLLLILRLLISHLVPSFI
ncbi:unnamed protein product, partial [Allacma fusca]